MGAKEYAAHARISARSLDYLRQSMNEGVQFSRTGRRVRYHVAEADDFITHQRRTPPTTPPPRDDLRELARREAARRPVKPTDMNGVGDGT